MSVRVGPPLEKAGRWKLPFHLCYSDLSSVVYLQYIDDSSNYLELRLHHIERDVVIPVGCNY